MTGTSAPGGIAPAVPVLSMFDPVHIGADEFGASVHMKVIYKNLLAAGEPGGGKSALLSPVPRTRPCRPVPPGAVRRQAGRARLLQEGRRRVRRPRHRPRHHHPAPPAARHGQPVRLAGGRGSAARSSPPTASPPSPRSSMRSPCISTVLGTKQQQEEFLTLFRDLVARGRAAAMPVIAATQRPIGRHHPEKPAGPVRLPRRVPLHLRRQQRHHPRRRLVRPGLHRHRHPAHQPGAVPPDRRRRHPPPRQGRLPHRRPHHRPGRPPPACDPPRRAAQPEPARPPDHNP